MYVCVTQEASVAGDRPGNDGNVGNAQGEDHMGSGISSDVSHAGQPGNDATVCICMQPASGHISAHRVFGVVCL
jgi:hypothetical protein